MTLLSTLQSASLPIISLSLKAQVDGVLKFGRKSTTCTVQSLKCRVLAGNATWGSGDYVLCKRCSKAKVNLEIWPYSVQSCHSGV